MREVIAEDGVTVLARYDYDPYGNVTALSGSLSDSDFLYTGHYYHQPSGLHLAQYRAYDAKTGRWISRDPLPNAEMLPEGPGLYGYVASNPINYFDRDGRFAAPIAVGLGGTIVGGLATGAIIYMLNEANRKAEQANERRAYKRRCTEQPPPNLTDPCDIARWLLQRNRDCASMRRSYAEKWFGQLDGPHLREIENYLKAANKLVKWIEENCVCPPGGK
ncbi:MAG: RHS repeat-associated core domain-containing protein [Verrucomicrobiota bacterium]